MLPDQYLDHHDWSIDMMVWGCTMSQQSWVLRQYETYDLPVSKQILWNEEIVKACSLFKPSQDDMFMNDWAKDYFKFCLISSLRLCVPFDACLLQTLRTSLCCRLSYISRCMCVCRVIMEVFTGSKIIKHTRANLCTWLNMQTCIDIHCVWWYYDAWWMNLPGPKGVLRPSTRQR